MAVRPPEYDYRNRTRDCEARYALYEQIEHDVRAMFPAIRLVTDAPWDAPLAEYMSTGDVDIKPFAGMHHGQYDSQYPSVQSGDPDQPSVEEIAAEQASASESAE